MNIKRVCIFRDMKAQIHNIYDNIMIAKLEIDGFVLIA